MTAIATLTLNPTIDGSSEAETVRHTHKVRTSNERFDPGGGGINVARVLARLGCDVEAMYLAGGVTGPVLGGLLERAGIPKRCVEIAGDTRISLAVHEQETGKEYRFVPAGPELTFEECQRCLDAVSQLSCSWLVVSGSLPRGVPDDFYADIIDIAQMRNMRLVLDTSGPALKAALARGGVYLVKPSLGEMEQLVGTPLRDSGRIIAEAKRVVESGGAEVIAVTMGHQGAIMAHAGGVLTLPALAVEVRSAVGAGDSFVAGMTHGLAMGRSLEDAFRLGIAAGTAAVMTPGTDLCRREDVERLAAAIGISGY
jgi:6-phosphofructokinase 2|tara:strand:- start:10599 stop:11534 length:936 start_codon:yes stop_codon:yes gene_type:complete